MCPSCSCLAFVWGRLAAAPNSVSSPCCSPGMSWPQLADSQKEVRRRGQLLETLEAAGTGNSAALMRAEEEEGERSCQAQRLQGPPSGTTFGFAVRTSGGSWHLQVGFWRIARCSRAFKHLGTHCVSPYALPLVTCSPCSRASGGPGGRIRRHGTEVWRAAEGQPGRHPATAAAAGEGPSACSLSCRGVAPAKQFVCSVSEPPCASLPVPQLFYTW